jgi:phosphodiesterase/alkaline phosphatase D-like protein
MYSVYNGVQKKREMIPSYFRGTKTRASSMGIATGIFLSAQIHSLRKMCVNKDRHANQMKIEAIELSVGSIRTGSSGNLGLPLVTVGEELLLVVQQLLTGLGGVLSVGG